MSSEKSVSPTTHGCDVWGYWKDQIKDKVPLGYSVYGEIVGYTPTGGAIQPGYSYGCASEAPVLQLQSRLLIYRVTYTGPDGLSFELPWLQMRGWCEARALETVPELFWGRASDLEPVLLEDTLDSWRDEFLTHVQKSWVHDQDCPHNPPGTPAEGVVVRIDKADGTCLALKCKNYRFLEQETKNLDKGVADLEESQEISEAEEAASDSN